MFFCFCFAKFYKTVRTNGIAYWTHCDMKLNMKVVEKIFKTGAWEIKSHWYIPCSAAAQCTAKTVENIDQQRLRPQRVRDLQWTSSNFKTEPRTRFHNGFFMGFDGFLRGLDGVLVGLDGFGRGFGGFGWGLDGFGWVWMGLDGVWVGFGWGLGGVWMGFGWGLDEFGWVWMGLDGFRWVSMSFDKKNENVLKW